MAATNAAAGDSTPIAVLPDFGVDMPQQPTESVSFPTPETTINQWVFGGSKSDYKKIYQHGWGIWAGLTKATTTIAFGIKKARTYQTWLSSGAILDAMNGEASAPVLQLRTPRQHHRHGIEGVDLLVEASTPTIHYAIAEVVAYSPTSAKHVDSNKLLWTETLNAYVEEGYTEIPPFPNAAVNIKPVYMLIRSSELIQTGSYKHIYMVCQRGRERLIRRVGRQRRKKWLPKHLVESVCLHRCDQYEYDDHFRSGYKLQHAISQ